MNETNERIEIIEGKCCGYCCGDCRYMDLNYTNKYDEAWCNQYEKYYSPSADASTCSYYTYEKKYNRY